MTSVKDRASAGPATHSGQRRENAHKTQEFWTSPCSAPFVPASHPPTPYHRGIPRVNFTPDYTARRPPGYRARRPAAADRTVAAADRPRRILDRHGIRCQGRRRGRPRALPRRVRPARRQRLRQLRRRRPPDGEPGRAPRAHAGGGALGVHDDHGGELAPADVALAHARRRALRPAPRAATTPSSLALHAANALLLLPAAARAHRRALAQRPRRRALRRAPAARRVRRLGRRAQGRALHRCFALLAPCSPGCAACAAPAAARSPPPRRSSRWRCWPSRCPSPSPSCSCCSTGGPSAAGPRSGRAPPAPRPALGLLPPARLWREKLPLFLLAAASGAATLLAQAAAGARGVRAAPPPRRPRRERPRSPTPATSARPLWPADLAFFYPYPAQPPHPRQVLAALLALLASPPRCWSAPAGRARGWRSAGSGTSGRSCRSSASSRSAPRRWPTATPTCRSPASSSPPPGRRVRRPPGAPARRWPPRAARSSSRSRP